METIKITSCAALICGAVFLMSSCAKDDVYHTPHPTQGALLLGISASLLCLYFLREGHIYAALLPQFYLVPHVLTWRRMVKIHSGKKLNSILGETSRNMLFMGILLAIGMIL